MLSRVRRIAERRRVLEPLTRGGRYPHQDGDGDRDDLQGDLAAFAQRVRAREKPPHHPRSVSPSTESVKDASRWTLTVSLAPGILAGATILGTTASLALRSAGRRRPEDNVRALRRRARPRRRPLHHAPRARRRRGVEHGARPLIRPSLGRLRSRRTSTRSRACTSRSRPCASPSSSASARRPRWRARSARW